MKYFDFSSGARDESISTFHLGRGMKYFDFSPGARDAVFRFFIWGEG